MSKAKIREDLWRGVPFDEALRDIIARNNTGYSYSELKERIKSGEDGLDEEEILQVDETVNTLLHLFVFYRGEES